VLPPDRLAEEYVDRMLAEYEAAYQQKNGTKTRPFPGMASLLQSLASAQIKIAVLSNKPNADTQACLASQFPDVRFDVAHGHRTGAALKPDPSVAISIAQELCLPPGQIVFVGDSAVDVQTALAAGMQPVGVTWGYRSEQEIRAGGPCRIVHSAAELSALLLTDHPH
jgi:phosphoglycolate phosphatase